MKEKIQFQGKEYTAKEIVNEFITPKAGRDTKAGQRYFILQKTLEPIFERLLAKDLEEWNPEKPPEQKGEGGEGEPQEGSANPFDQDYQEYKENNPDQIDPEDIEDLMDKKKE